MNNWISVAWTSSSSWPPAIISDTNWSAALSFYEPVKKMTLEVLTKVKEECRSWTCCFSWESIWKIDVLKFQSNAFQWIAFESACAVRKSLLWTSLHTDMKFWFNYFWLQVRFLSFQVRFLLAAMRWVLERVRAVSSGSIFVTGYSYL